VKREWIPDAGDLVWLSFDPQRLPPLLPTGGPKGNLMMVPDTGLGGSNNQPIQASSSSAQK
jgi:hypothetical protein